MLKGLYQKIPHAILLAAGCIWLMAGCAGLPDYNLSGDGDPAAVVAAFLDAVISGGDADVSDWVEQYSWESAHADRPFGGAAVSETDLQLLNNVKDSRDYEIVGESEYPSDRHHAIVRVNYTSFDIGKFQDKLTDEVMTEVRRRQNEGEVFGDASDTADIIGQYKAELLQNPKVFYTTRQYAVELVSRKGRWRVVLSDEFYNALSGYAL